MGMHTDTGCSLSDLYTTELQPGQLSYIHTWLAVLKVCNNIIYLSAKEYWIRLAEEPEELE